MPRLPIRLAETLIQLTSEANFASPFTRNSPRARIAALSFSINDPAAGRFPSAVAQGPAFSDFSGANSPWD
jgi:hypothetical protein